MLSQRPTDPKIAKALYMDPLMTKTRVANILGKTGLKNRREIARAARKGSNDTVNLMERWSDAWKTINAGFLLLGCWRPSL